MRIHLPIGIGLSAACGFRVFVPLLSLSIAAESGHITLSPGFEWIGSSTAMFAFGTATVLPSSQRNRDGRMMVCRAVTATVVMIR